jgi:N-acetylmuramoyl-L-alanine amidase
MGKTINVGFVTDTINGIKVNSSIQTKSSNYNDSTNRSVSYCVMHYTGNTKDTAKANATYFKNGSRSASAHFFVDENSIYQGVELRDIAWHCGAKKYNHASCRNANSIGIEMCTSGNSIVSETTKKNAAYLCAYVCQLIGITADLVDTYVLRHYDVTGKTCPAQMAGKDNAEWTAFKESVKEILGGGANANSQSKGDDTKTAKTADGVYYTVVDPYCVKITADSLNVRKGPGTSYGIATAVKSGEKYTIIGEKKVGTTTWGYLKSKVGWISLKFTSKC